METAVRSRQRHGWLALCSLLVAASAFVGALGLCFGFLALGDTVSGRLPFGSPVLGGVALALLVGVPFSALAWWAWRDSPRTAAAAVLVGIGLVGWLVVELAFIRMLSFFHPVFTVIGICFVAAGLHVSAEERRISASHR